MNLITRFVRDESAQDIVEYAYLVLFVGLSGMVVWPAIVTLLGLRYGEYNTNVQSLWVPDPPGGGS